MGWVPKAIGMIGIAWRGYDPNDPAVKSGQLNVEQELLDRWTPLCNFNSDYVIDMKDMRFFAENWLWRACWHRQAPDPLPPFNYAVPSYGVTFEPNEPEWDPNDLLGFGMMRASSPDSGSRFIGDSSEGMSLSLESESMPSYDPDLTARQLEETIEFLYGLVAENPEEADNIIEMIKSLQEELEVISETETFSWQSQ